MADLPSNMSYGTVTGQFVTSVIDTADAGRDPDMTPCVGTISFHPNATRVINTGALPNPLTIFNKDITTSLDSSGYIVGPDGVRGIKLIASDDPDISPTMFSYSVTINLVGVSPLSFSFMLPGGATIDLTTVAPVPADMAGETAAWVAAVESTRLNVVAAQSAQSAAEAARNAAISAGVPTPTVAGHVLTALTATTYGWASAAAAASDPLKANLANPTFTGTVSGITKSMVGLASVDNTTDAAKPLSTATSTALGLRAPLASPTFTGTVSGVTKAMVGLANADNTTDAAKPVSSATQTALNNKVNVGSVSSSLNSVKTPTVWATGTVYGVGDYFSTSFGVIYRVVVAHTAAAAEPTAATTDFAVWGSSGNFPGSVIVRNSLGEVSFSAAYATDVPTATYELTNKLYVDTQVSSISVPAQPFTFYPIVWNGSAWTYGNVVVTARPSGMRAGDVVFFDGVGTLPTWATTNDLMTEG